MSTLFRSVPVPSLRLMNRALLCLTMAAAPACGNGDPSSGMMPPPDEMTDKPMPADPDCPPDVDCEVIPAAYAISNPKTGSYGNYDVASRPDGGLDIRYIVIHDTDATYDVTLKVFQDPANVAAAHYVVRSSDGHVVKMISPKNVAWHAGNWYFNMHSIGIEHIGFAGQGYAWYSEEMYQASAKLVRFLAKRYNIPLDRAHIFGHEEVPGGTQAKQRLMHWDPGPYWNWEHYMELLNAPDAGPADDGAPAAITIAPKFADNKPAASYCFGPNEASDCRTELWTSANFLYLHTQPDENSPLIVNSYLSSEVPDRVYNWGNKAATGRTYYRSERQGNWDAIFFGGIKAWLYNPDSMNTRRATATIITPRDGAATVPVYGFAYPEASAYMPPTTPQTVEKIYDLAAGQRYIATGRTTADYYWAKEFSPTGDTSKNVEVKDSTEYYQLEWNHRLALVRVADVVEVP